MMLTKHWFKCTGDKIYHLKYPKTWFCAAVNWSEDRTEAFAGQHAENVLVIYDEASAIQGGELPPMQDVRTMSLEAKADRRAPMMEEYNTADKDEKIIDTEFREL